MNTHADKTQENKSKAVANSFSEQQSSSESTFPFTDNRPEAIAQRRLQQMMDQSHQVRQLRVFYNQANSAARASDRKPEEFTSLERASETEAPIQLASEMHLKGIYGNTDDFKSEDFEYTYITPEGEVFAEERERPQMVEFNVHAKQKSKVTYNPLAFFSPKTNSYDDLAGYHRGHVFGYKLGGPGDPINIVPMLAAFNTGIWNTFEELAHTRAYRLGLRNLRIEIIISYDDDSDPRIPIKFLWTWTAYNQKDKTIEKVTNEIYHVIEEPTLEEHEQEEIKNKLAQTEEEEIRKRTMSNFRYYTSKMWRTIEEWIAKFDNHEEALEPILTKGQLPSIPNLYPENPDDRPYEQLDILYISGELDFNMPEGYNIAQTFTKHQKELILKTNLAKNGGKLKSDDPDDPHKKLLVGGTLNRPEIDHIVPRSKGGSNFFANARVVSWELNNRIARIKK